MYEISQLVVYGIHGVCKILETEERTVDHKNILYYVLEPVAQPGTRFYLPCQNPSALSKIRPLLTQEDLRRILRESLSADAWIQDENRRKLYYRQIISSVDAAALLSMVRCLHQHKDAQMALGRRLHICDENFLRDAERVLTGELSIVLSVPETEVPSRLTEMMDTMDM